MKYIFVLTALAAFYLNYFPSSNASFQVQKPITKSCDLNDKINDTIIVAGTYSVCMEYSSFYLLEKNKCDSEFNMSLGFNQARFTNKIENRLDKMDGCGVSLKLTIKGIFRKEKDANYGHLGSNSAEFEVLEFIKYGKVKSKKIK